MINFVFCEYVRQQNQQLCIKFFVLERKCLTQPWSFAFAQVHTPYIVFYFKVYNCDNNNMNQKYIRCLYKMESNDFHWSQFVGNCSLSNKVPSMSFYPNFILILSRFYLDTIQVLFRFYSEFLETHYFIQILS